MPLYQIDAPDGRTYSIEGPEGATRDQVIAAVLRRNPNAAKPPEEESFFGAIGRGVKEHIPGMQETLGGAQTLLGVAAKKAMGQGAVSDYLLERGKANLQETNVEQGMTARKTDSLTNAWEKGVGSVLTEWLPHTMGAGAASILESLAVAGAGAAVGTAMAPGAGTVAGAAQGLIGKMAVKKGIKEAAEKVLKDQGEEAAQAFIAAEAKKTLQRMGAKGATAAVSVGQGLGEVGSRAAQAQEERGEAVEGMDLTRALPAAGLHMVADYIADRTLLGGLAKGAAKAGKEGVKEGATKAITKGVLATGAKEIPAELVQTGAERFGAQLDLTSPEAIREYIDTAGAAGVTGGIAGGAGAMRRQGTQVEDVEEPPAPVEGGPVESVEAQLYRMNKEKQKAQGLEPEVAAEESIREPKLRKGKKKGQPEAAAEQVPLGETAEVAPEVVGDAPATPEAAEAGVETTGAAPASTPITLENIEQAGVKSPVLRKWFEANVVGKTQADVAALVKDDISLVKGNGQRAKVLKELLTPPSAAYVEPPVGDTAQQPSAEPNVAAPVQPSAEPERATQPDTEGTSTPVGGGVVPSAGRAVDESTATPTGPAALSWDDLTNQYSTLNAQVVALNSKRRKTADEKSQLTTLATEAAALRAELDKRRETEQYEPTTLETQQAETQGPEPTPAPAAELTAAEEAPTNVEIQTETASATPTTRGFPAARDASPTVEAAGVDSEAETTEIAPGPLTGESKARAIADPVVDLIADVETAQTDEEYAAALDRLYYRSQNSEGTRDIRHIREYVATAGRGFDKDWGAAAARHEAAVNELGARYRSAQPAQVTPENAISHAELQGIADSVSRSLGGEGDVTILDSIKDIAPGLPAGSRAGLVRDGQVYLFRDGIPSGIEGQKTVFHELFHKGLQRLFPGVSYFENLNRLYDTSAEVRQRAEQKLSTDPDIRQTAEREASAAGVKNVDGVARAIATDEVLADMAEENINPSTLRQIGSWLASIAQRLGMPDLARAIRVMGKSDLQKFVHDALAAAVDAKRATPADAARAATTAGFTPTDRARKATQQDKDLDALVKTSEIGKPAKSGPQKLKEAVSEIMDTTSGTDLITKARVKLADVAASVEEKLTKGLPKDLADKVMRLYRQADDSHKLLAAFVRDGDLTKDTKFNHWHTKESADGLSVESIMKDIARIAKERGQSFDTLHKRISKMWEAKRLDSLEKSGAEMPIHQLSKAFPGNAREQIDLALATLEQDTDAQKVIADFNKLRGRLIDKMVETGRITEAEGKEWKDNESYVVFDREGNFGRPITKKRRTGQGQAQLGGLPELQGTTEYEVGNTLDNTIKLFGWMIDQAVRNDSVKNTLRALEAVGAAEGPVKNKPAKDSHLYVTTYLKGVPSFFKVQNEYDVAAFSTMTEPKIAVLRMMGQFSQALRKSITLFPAFAMKQIIEDIPRAMLFSGVKQPRKLIIPSIVNFASIAYTSGILGKQHPLVQQAERYGLTGELDFNNRKPADTILQDLGYRPRGKLGTVLHRLEEISRASDISVRMAVYDQTKKESKGDVSLAQARARELINFRRRGSSHVLSTLITIVPFMNAAVQGKDVLLRAITGKQAVSGLTPAEARKHFYSNIAKLMGLTFLYTMAKAGDDEYEEASLELRNNNFLIGGVKIPVPGDLAAIFKVPVESALEYIRRSGTAEEQTAAEATITALMFALGEMAVPEPISTAARPIIEAFTNHSFFTGRELEGAYQKNLEPSQRYTTNTSELAKAIARFTSDTFGEQFTMSPILIDNFLRGWAGSAATTVTMLTDQMLNPDKLDRPVHKYWMLSSFLYDPAEQSRRTDEFFDERSKVQLKYNTLKALEKRDPDAAYEYLKKNELDLVIAEEQRKTSKRLSDLREARRFMVEGTGWASDWSKADRQKYLKDVEHDIKLNTGWMRETKTSLRRLLAKAPDTDAIDAELAALADSEDDVE